MNIIIELMKLITMKCERTWIFIFQSIMETETKQNENDIIIIIDDELIPNTFISETQTEAMQIENDIDK